MRLADDGDFGDAGHRARHVFDLAGRDVLAADLQDVLVALAVEVVAALDRCWTMSPVLNQPSSVKPLALASGLSKYSRKSCCPRTPRTQSSPISPSVHSAPGLGIDDGDLVAGGGVPHRARRVVLALDLTCESRG